MTVYIFKEADCEAYHMIYYVAGIPYSDELYHHGIKGQKWGVRRFQNKDGSLTALGQKHRYENRPKRYAGEEDHGEKGDKKQAMKFGAKVAYDLITLNPIGLVSDSVREGKAIAGRIRSNKYAKERENSELDSKTGLKLKAKEMNEKDDLKRVNPDVNDFNSNSKSNCMLCTSTYELRRRGFDVTAKKASKGYKDDEVLSWFPKAKIEKISDDNRNMVKEGLTGKTNKAYVKKVIDTMQKQPDGARGNIMINWAGSFGAGHSMIYSVKNGKLTIMDGQTNKIYDNPERILQKCTDVRYARLDNVDFDKNKIKECCG